MRDFKKFNIWNNGMEIVVSTYQLTRKLPSGEKFGLISQMCRAAVSIPCNIAEGCSRNSEIEFKRFLEISLGSSFELETQLLICERLSFVSKKEIDEQILPLNELQKKINSLVTKIKDSKNSY